MYISSNFLRHDNKYNSFLSFGFISYLCFFQKQGFLSAKGNSLFNSTLMKAEFAQRKLNDSRQNKVRRGKHDLLYQETPKTHNDYIKVIFNSYLINDVREFCKNNNFEVLASAKNKATFIKNYLFKIGVIDENNNTCELQLTSPDYNLHNKIEFEFVENEDSSDYTTTTEDSEQKVDKKSSYSNNNNEIIENEVESEEEVNNLNSTIPKDVQIHNGNVQHDQHGVVALHSTDDSRLSHLCPHTKRMLKSVIKTNGVLTFINICDHPNYEYLNVESRAELEKIFINPSSQSTDKEIVLTSLNEIAMSKLSPFTERFLKIQLEKADGYLTCDMLFAMDDMKNVELKDKKILFNFFHQIEEDSNYDVEQDFNLLTKEIFDADDNFYENLSPHSYNLISEKLISGDHTGEGGMQYIDVLDLMHILTMEEKLFLDSYFMKEEEPNPNKKRKISHNNNSILDLDTTSTEKTASTKNSFQFDRRRLNIVKDKKDHVVVAKSIEHEKNKKKQKYKGELNSMVMKPYKSRDDEDQAVRETSATLESRVSYPLLYSDAVRYYVTITWPRNKEKAPFFGFQSYYLQRVIKKILEKWNDESSHPFNKDHYETFIETYGQCVEPGSNEYKEDKGKAGFYKRYNLFLLFSIKGSKFVEWKKMGINSYQQKTLVESLTTSFMKSIFHHNEFEYLYVNEFEEKDYNREGYNGQLVPMSAENEYPKATGKLYISKMSRKIASTRGKPSDFFKKLRECTFSFHFDLDLYNIMTPTDLEILMESIGHDVDNINEQHEKVFQTKKWWRKDSITTLSDSF